MSKLPDKKKYTSNSKLMVQYAGIGVQILSGLLVCVFGGKWLDSKLHFSFPVLIWILPLIFIIGITIKAIKDTSGKNNE